MQCVCEPGESKRAYSLAINGKNSYRLGYSNLSKLYEITSYRRLADSLFDLRSFLSRFPLI